MSLHKCLAIVFVCLLGLAAAGLADISRSGSPVALAMPLPEGTPIFVPILSKGSSGASTPTPTSTTTTEQGAVWLPYRLANTTVLPTYGASVAADSRGGLHVAFGLLGHYDQAEGGYASYAYCAGACTQKENWRYLHLGQSSEVRLLLDPAGHPRLLLAVPGDVVGMFQHVSYQYGACNTACTEAAHWTFTTVANVIDSIAWVGGREDENNHYFALDPQGRPAFLYTRFDPDDPYTGYLDYRACVVANAAGCTQAGNWSTTVLAHNSFPQNPSFVFTQAGQPRLALQVSTGLESSLWYAACDQNCTNAGNWSWTGISATSYYETVTFSLRVDSQGRPRMAFYSGTFNQSPSPFADDLLYYLWCDQACANGDAGNWHGVSIGLPTLSGHDVEMALDGQNRPRLVYTDRYSGLGYSWCNETCESTNTTWHHSVAETSASLSDDFEVLPIRRCTISTWFTGVRPTLALDSQGNLRIAYDAQHYWYGTEIVNGEIRHCNFKDVNVTRFAAVNRP